ncbi:Cilia- and flagella-associated protein 74 [Channa argus]|uniref:Cilia-and flagella-associated protein 74 n=1 Tax=Channa argus TaxID=215402 RepID=A0A6G1Q1Z1_CHAAH|nr:Cilia- and flagella-associated protein 74 [Channa argus]
MFKLRRNLDQLDCFHRQKEHDVLKAREGLKQCHQNIESLMEQRENLEREIEREKAADNRVAVFRLRAQHRQMCQKLQSEEELEGHFNIELNQQELELSEVEVDISRFSSLRQEVEEEERDYRILKVQKASMRLQQERKANYKVQLKMQHLKDKQAAMIKKEETNYQRKIAEGRANRKIAVKYLKETIKRMQQQEAEKEQKNRELLEKKIQAVKSLKSNIAATQESLRVQQSRAKANTQKKEQQQRQLRESLQAQGLNSIKQLEERQKLKRVNIVAKILQEEQLRKSKDRNQVLLPKPSNTNKFLTLERAREKLCYYLDSRPSSAVEERTTTQLREFSDISSSSTASSDTEDLEETMLQEGDYKSPDDSLVEPEFCGLWEQNYKDFEVGKVYKKKIILTNMSYKTNHCKFVRVSGQLKDFISINFEPPGCLSVGMSCDLQTVFQPKINEDLEGEVQFVSAEGPFSVPVRCTIKKCDLEVDSQFIDFGSHVVGQTISRTITLTNKGALGTLFSLVTSPSLSPETSDLQMPPKIIANASQETSSQNTVSDNQKSSASIDAVELQPEQKSQEHSAELQHDHRAVSETSAAGPDAYVQENPSDSNEISLGNVREGEIGPFQSIKLEVIFTPTIPGEATLDFHIKFSNSSSKPIPIKVRGFAVSIPVWVVQPNIDMKICMFDFLYQESITVQSRASTALKLTFEVCPEMRKHIEILPKTGFIQAESRFNAQLKFLPRCSLSKDGRKYFDEETGVLEVPMTVHVAGQVQSIGFTVHAVVTSSNLQFDQTEVDFGYCSIYQSVKSTVRLTNLSLLPQDFGFLGIPEFIDVQPNDGFGTLLPHETLEIDLIFSASKAKEYSFRLTCKSGANRDFLLNCRAVGVRPPLELSHSLVQFGATAVGDQSTAILYLINKHTERAQSKQQVTSAFKDAVTPGTPRLFSFTTPEHSEIHISPSAGRLLPGERCLVQVMFRPRLVEQEIREEALRLHYQSKLLHEKELERTRQAEQKCNPLIVSVFCKSKKDTSVESTKGKKAPVNAKNCKVSDDLKTDKLSESPDPADIQPGSELYEQARASLLYSFTQCYSEYTIPCFISDGDPPEEDRQAQPAWSPFNTLYVKLQCLAVQPPLVVISNNGNNIIDFQQVAVGTQNYSGLSVFSVVPIEGSIAPGQSQDITVIFQPDHSSVNYSDTLTIELTNKSKVCVMDLKGAASSHNMYLYGADVLTVPIESLLPPLITCQPQLTGNTEPKVMEKDHMPVLVTLRATYRGGVIVPAMRELHVGCIHSVKKSGEFYWDSVPSLQQQGFSVEPIKGSVEAGEKRTITVTWTPQSGYKPYEVVKTCVPLTLKEHEKHVYRVTLMALVSITEE